MKNVRNDMKNARPHIPCIILHILRTLKILQIFKFFPLGNIIILFIDTY